MRPVTSCIGSTPLRSIQFISIDEALCYAIFEQIAPAVRESSREVNLDQDWFWETAEVYGVGMAPS